MFVMPGMNDVTLPLCTEAPRDYQCWLPNPTDKSKLMVAEGRGKMPDSLDEYWDTYALPQEYTEDGAKRMLGMPVAS